MDLSPPAADGVLHPAYDNPRPEVVDLVPSGVGSVLDLGCSTGQVAAAVAAHEASRPVPGSVHTVGVEVDAGLATSARTRLDHVVHGDLDRLDGLGRDAGTVLDGPFDVVLAADVLEHLRDPWAVVAWASARVAPGGALITSVPNVRHAHTVGALLRGRWRYDEVGIFDRTHLRFFARCNALELAASGGLEVDRVERTHLLSFDPTSRWNRLAPHLGDWGTLQWVVRARRVA